MLKYAKVENEETKECIVGIGDPNAIYRIETVQEEDGSEEWTEQVEVIHKEPKYKDVEKVIYVRDFWEQELGLTEQEVEQAYNGNWYLLGYAPVKPAQTKEEISVTRKRLYTDLVDPLTSQIQRLRDEEQTERIISQIESLKNERSELVKKIKEENPYPISSEVETKENLSLENG